MSIWDWAKKEAVMPFKEAKWLGNVVTGKTSLRDAFGEHNRIHSDATEELGSNAFTKNPDATAALIVGSIFGGGALAGGAGGGGGAGGAGASAGGVSGGTGGFGGSGFGWPQLAKSFAGQGAGMLGKQPVQQSPYMDQPIYDNDEEQARMRQMAQALMSNRYG